MNAAYNSKEYGSTKYERSRSARLFLHRFLLFLYFHMRFFIQIPYLYLLIAICFLLPLSSPTRCLPAAAAAAVCSCCVSYSLPQ